MKKFLIFVSTLVAIIVAGYLVGAYAYAAPFPVAVGGTGATTLTGCLTGNGTSPITANGTCATFAFPFTPQSWGNSTSTTIGFLNGLISTASTTFSQLSTGAMYDQNGLVLAHATTSASTASQDVWRDANQNAFAQNFVSAATVFPSNGASATLTAASPRTWIITGTKTQTLKLPVGTTLSNGTMYIVNDNSTGTTTITDNGNNVIGVVLPGGNAEAILYDNSTSNGTWDFHSWLGHQVYSGSNNVSVGTSSPWATLSVHANPTDATVYTTLFAIGSSTASATTTLFSINNIGSTTIGNFGGCSGSNALNTNSSGTISCGAITGFSTFSYPFPNQVGGGNATSSLTGFTGGILSLASTTIGNGSITGGLTISGTATTSAVSLGGDITPTVDATFQVGTATRGLGEIFLASNRFINWGASTPNILGNSSTNKISLSSGTLFAADYASTTALTTTGELEAPHGTTAYPSLYAGDLYVGTNGYASTSIAVGTTTVPTAGSLFVTHSVSVTLASSTLAYYGSFGASGTTTTVLINPLHGSILHSFYCQTDTGTAWVGFTFGSGTETTEVQCTTSGASSGTLGANNVGQGRQAVKVNVGHSASTPNLITITADVEDTN